jgi:trypsin
MSEPRTRDFGDCATSQAYLNPRNTKSPEMLLSNLLSLCATGVTALLISKDDIVNGTEVSEFKYGFMASIQEHDEHFCGGSIINPTTLLTAAHCSVGITAFKNYTVRAHRHNLTKTDFEEKGVVFEVLNVTVHPDYNDTDADTNHDVAIWKLRAIQGNILTLNTHKVALDDGKNSVPGQMLNGIGWGLTSENGTVSDVLQEVRLPIVADDVCRSEYPNLSDTSICAGYQLGGKDTCNGDSGGPLFAMEDSKAIIVGLTSYGNGCARADNVGVYTRILHPSVNQFIQEHIQDNLQE